jgi:hypothetical protein
MDPDPGPAPMNPSPQPPPAPESPGPASAPRRRNGKVARKPKLVRDKINILMNDGIPYKQIIAALGDDGLDLNEDSLSNWRPGGHQDWLKEQEALAEWSAKWEFGQDLVNRGHGLTIHQVVNQMLASQIHDAINDAGPSVIQNALQADPRNIIPLIQAIAGLTQAELDSERFRLLEAVQRPSPTGADPKSIKPETIRKIEQDLNLL